jgi:LysR family glycine cleavage system transcriptional activator
MIDWRTLPSLPALRAFDAAARVGSYSEAARTLNVTHAAVAQHVRTLEKHFGQRLMVRAGQGMALTAEGALLSGRLAEGFDAIAQAVGQLTDLTAGRPLAISCTPSFAENWLMPRIAQFWQTHPEIDIAIHPTPKLIDFRSEQIDCAVRYGNGDWPGLVSTQLLTGDFIVTAAPGFAPPGRVTDIAALRDKIWLTNSTVSELHVLTRDLGLDIDQTRVRTLATNGMVLAAARSGLGLAVQSRVLARQDLADGRLVEVMALKSPGLGYWIVHPDHTIDPRLRAFNKWLVAQAALDRTAR